MTQRLVQGHNERQDYETPPALVAALSERFGPFQVDFAGSEANKKAPIVFTAEQDSLSLSWDGMVGFLNPPYGRMTGKFVAKAATSRAKVTCLLPARTDTKWFHKWVWDKENHRPRPNVVHLDFLPGRTKFLIDGKPVLALDKRTGKWRVSAGKFPSVVIVFDNLSAKGAACENHAYNTRNGRACPECGKGGKQDD